jgi:molybdopterin/thiamine biosynthesis adenylyltransferase
VPSGDGEIRIVESQWDELRDRLLTDGVEHAALMICGVHRTSSRTVLLVRRVVPLHDDDFLDRTDLSLSIAPSTLARFAKQARGEGATLVLCHSHPFPGDVVASPIDLDTEADLCGRVLAPRLGLPVGALVVGPDSLDGRLWKSGTPARLSTLRVIGARVAVLEVSSHGLSSAGRAAVRIRSTTGESSGDAATARQVLLWGEAGQAILRDAHVAVVGAGGTGSHVLTQLAHLRIGKLTIIDPDLVELSNLSRLIGSAPSDVGRPKAEVLAATTRTINPSVEVSAVVASVLDTDPAHYVDADIIVCATDGHGSRALLIEVVSQYLVPVIDLGVEVDPADDRFRAGGGVRILRPGKGCLLCAQTLSPALIREEYLDAEQRSREVRLGYIRGVEVPAPSVVALNGVVASLAVLELCQLLVGMLGSGSSRLLYRAEQRALTTTDLPSRRECHVCGEAGVLGLGDSRRLPTRFRSDDSEVYQALP